MTHVAESGQLPVRATRTPSPSRCPSTQPAISTCFPPTLPAGGLEAFWFWFWFWLGPDSRGGSIKDPTHPQDWKARSAAADHARVHFARLGARCVVLGREVVKRHGSSGGPLCPRAGGPWRRSPTEMPGLRTFQRVRPPSPPALTQ